MALTIDRPDYTAAELNSVWNNLIATLAPRLPYYIRVNSSGGKIDDLDINETDQEALNILEPFDVMIALARKGQTNGEGLWNAVYDQEEDKYRLDVRESLNVSIIQENTIVFPIINLPERLAYVYLDELPSKVFEYSSDKFTTDTANGWTRDNLYTQEVFTGLGYEKWGVGESGVVGLIEDFEDFFSKGYEYFNSGNKYLKTRIETFDEGAWPEGVTPSDTIGIYKTIDISTQVTGSATTFTLPSYDTTENVNLRVYYNGQRLTTGQDVTILSATTFSMTFPPVSGSELVVDYKPL